MTNKNIYEFLQGKTLGLTEQWYACLDKTKGGVYGSKDSAVINRVKEQNQAFHLRFISIFDTENETGLLDFQDWIGEIAQDPEYLDTPLPDILGGFFYTEKQYLGLMKEYALQYPDQVSLSSCTDLCSRVTDTINEIVLEFSRLHMNLAAERLTVQQELVMEMSAPVIQLGEKIGLLPLVGEVQAERAQMILEQALDQSVQKGIDVLFIDLSGVAVIDTMVAQQIFQLTDALKLIGVTPALAGMGPHIAQTAVQLGISFEDVPIYSTLTQALAFRTHHSL